VVSPIVFSIRSIFAISSSRRHRYETCQTRPGANNNRYPNDFVATAIPLPHQMQMNFQGRLTDASGNPVADGSYNMEFWLLDAD
jgi:hypothetical protein